MKKINKNNDNNNESIEEKKLSFFEKIKTDKKYNAKVQLIGYGILIVAVLLYLNLSSSGTSAHSGNTIIGNVNSNGGIVDENTDLDEMSLLEQINNNYSYDIQLVVEKKQVRGENEDEKIEDEEQMVRYFGKVYQNVKEITREDGSLQELYYKVDNRYYTKLDDEMNLVDEKKVYSLVEAEYVEIDSILQLLNQASLDHVTDYSSGKKEYVYHLKVKDVIVSYKLEDVIEIEIEEENGVVEIEMDYSNLLKVVNDEIVTCKLEATITEIGTIKEFFDFGEKENTAEES